MGLIKAFRGAAADVIYLLPENVRLAYKLIMSKLEEKFGRKHLQKANMMQLKTRTQKTDESIQELFFFKSFLRNDKN